MVEKVWGAVIVAAGSGTRFGSAVPKQFLRLHDVPLVEWSIAAFSAIDEIGEIVVVVPAVPWQEFWRPPDGVKTVTGGPRRQDSVLAGLKALDSSGMVLIHDAARPLVSASVIRRVMKGAIDSGAAVPVIPVSDTVKSVTSSSFINRTVPRNNLRLSQTPQGFVLEEILQVLEDAENVTDECSAMELSGYNVQAVAGDPGNMKLTGPEDFMLVESFSRAGAESRTGTGIDFHPFEKGIPFVLGGCLIESEFGLAGHSDGDAVLHAVADALLSAARLGDIGVLFPPEDDMWKDADSAILLDRVCRLVRNDDWKIVQVDVTVISDFPGIAPIRDTMISRIAGIIGTAPESVWIKGTTTNSLGDIGKGRGLGCLALTRILRTLI